MSEQKIITPNYEWYTYDVEVFKYDFIVVFKNKRTKEYAIFHNDNLGVRDFILDTAIYCGFNTKGYDQYTIKGVDEEQRTLQDRGFYSIEPNEVYKFFEDMAIIHGRTEQLHKYPETEQLHNYSESLFHRLSNLH